MKTKELSQFSKEELQAEIKKRRFFFGVFIGMLLTMFSVGIYLTTKQGFGIFSILPVAFLPMLMLIRKSTLDAKKELESRN